MMEDERIEKTRALFRLTRYPEWAIYREQLQALQGEFDAKIHRKGSPQTETDYSRGAYDVLEELIKTAETSYEAMTKIAEREKEGEG